MTVQLHQIQHAQTQLHWGMSGVRDRGLRTRRGGVTVIEPQVTSRLKSANHNFRTFSSAKPPEMRAFPGQLVFKHFLTLSPRLTSSLALKGCCRDVGEVLKSMQSIF